MHFINKAQENAFMTLRLEVHMETYPRFWGLTGIAVIWSGVGNWVESGSGVINEEGECPNLLGSLRLTLGRNQRWVSLRQCQ